MATNLAIDDDLLRQAVRLGKQRTKKATVNEALREYVQRRQRLQASELFRRGGPRPLLRLQDRAQEAVIVLDTSILSLAFRRRPPDEGTPPQVAALRKLIADDVPLAVPGIVLQELLSGVRSREQFRKLQKAMTGFPLLLASEAHHVRAAEINNACRHRGVACSAIDALIAALTIKSGGRLFTTDGDFQRIATHCNLKLVALPRETR